MYFLSLGSIIKIISSTENQKFSFRMFVLPLMLPPLDSATRGGRSTAVYLLPWPWTTHDIYLGMNSGIERNSEPKHYHPRVQRISVFVGRTTARVCRVVSLTLLSLLSMGFTGCRGGQSVGHRLAVTSILQPHKSREWRGLLHWDKAVLTQVTTAFFEMRLRWLPSKCSCVRWIISATSWDIQLRQWTGTHMTTACRGRYVLRLLTVFRLSVN